MAIHTLQLREMVDEVLRYLHPQIPYTQDAVELVVLTIATESHGGTYFRQVKGPARGIVQMEPATEADIWKWVLGRNPSLREKVMALVNEKHDTLPALKYNVAYQIAMCRIHYFRVPESIPMVSYVKWDSPKYGTELVSRPDRESVVRLAKYWKRYYNTPWGSGTVERAVDDYFRYGA